MSTGHKAAYYFLKEKYSEDRAYEILRELSGIQVTGHSLIWLWEENEKSGKRIFLCSWKDLEMAWNIMKDGKKDKQK